MESKQCFVPLCPKNSNDNPDLLSVPIPECLRKEWCREVKTVYFTNYLQYCCEDHLIREDIKNYYKCKLMNEQPKMASTARLRRIPLAEPKKRSVLGELLLQCVDTLITKPKKQKLDENTLPSTTASTLHFQVDAATQCDKKVHHKGTNTHFKNKKFHSPRSSTSTSLWEEEDVNIKELSSPSIRNFSSETDSEDQSEVITEFNLRKKFLTLIYNKPNMYLGLPQQYKWLINHIVQKSNIKISDLSLIITLFKIKQNDTLERMCDQFEVTRPMMTTFINHGIEVLANFFQNFVFLPSA